MTRLGAISAVLIAAALLAGAIADEPHPLPPLWLGGYRVLACDFHVHDFPFSASTLASWDLALEARRQGLDAIAITPHNYVTGLSFARAISRWRGGVELISGEEIHTPGYHMIAIGIDRTISWRKSALDSINEIHRQGGVAIAAHPMRDIWRDYADDALRRLDASEVEQPVVYSDPLGKHDLLGFYRNGHYAAIGSSDYHGMGPLGMCRTWVFAKDATQRGIVDAVRAHRTVVYDEEGHPYGDPDLIQMADRADLKDRGAPKTSWLDLVSRYCGLFGLAGVLLSGFRVVYSAEEKEQISQ